MRTSSFLKLVKKKCNDWGISFLIKSFNNVFPCNYYSKSSIITRAIYDLHCNWCDFDSSNCDFRKQAHQSTKNTQSLVSVPIKFKEFPRYLQNPIIRSWHGYHGMTCENSFNQKKIRFRRLRMIAFSYI